MNKQELIKKITKEAKDVEREPYDSEEETRGFLDAMEIVIGYIQQLDEPSPPEGCGYCLGGEDQIRCIMTYPEGCPSDKGFEFVVNFCPNCGAKIKREGTK